MAGTLHPLTVIADGSFAPAIKSTTYTVTRTLAATTAEYINVPTGAKYVLLNGSTAFMARYNATQAGTAAAAFGDATPDNPHEVITEPAFRFLQDVTEISVIAGGACEVSAVFFS